MNNQVKNAIAFARSSASTGGPESIKALNILADEVDRLQEALKGAHIIVDVAKGPRLESSKACGLCGLEALNIADEVCRSCLGSTFNPFARIIWSD